MRGRADQRGIIVLVMMVLIGMIAFLAYRVISAQSADNAPEIINSLAKPSH